VKKYYLILATYFISLITCFAQSQSGPNNPDTVLNNSATGTKIWRNAIYAKDSNHIYAIDTMNGSGLVSNYLEATGFHFSIPGNATVTGFTVRVTGYDSIGFNGTCTIYTQLIKSGVIQSHVSNGLRYHRHTNSLVDTSLTFGACDSLWNNSWLDTEINSSHFGVALYAKTTFVVGPTPFCTLKIDGIQITVCYNIPTSAETLSQTSAANYVYPNPSRGLFTFTTKSTDPCNIEIYNMLGQTVYKTNLSNGGSNNIDISSQPNGVYLYKVENEQGSILEQGKLVVEK
jgi:hypothetical protein